MLQQISTFIAKNHLLKHDKPVIVGLSGGADSVALLDILQKLAYKCVAAHCNFLLRGAASEADEVFVTKLCSEGNVTLFVKKFETKQFARAKNISIEMAARELRYQWFESLLTENDAQAIAVAHHQNDNIETLLLNLARGTGLKGLCGIPVRNGNVVRPLLNVSKLDIENYIKVNNLHFVSDSTNFENNFKRNKIRNEVLPLLAMLNPSIEHTLAEEINHFKGIYRVYESCIENIKNELLTIENNLIKIQINKLLQQSDIPAVLFETIKNYGFNFAQTLQIVNVLNAESGKMFYSEKHQLIKDRDFILIKQKILNNTENEYLIELNCKKIDKPIDLELKKYSKKNDFILKNSKNIIQIDYNKIKFPLILRKWKSGDFFFPFGMKKTQKLSDFLINNKISLSEKEDIWLLLSDSQIVWIVGHRLDNRFRIDKNTQTIFEISNYSQRFFLK
ncbi:tRNA(Ile)-lysidine synthase [Bacteroidia bacterium]|nr:tRNA(Ile)-lysidine synthase [Bacteroidia bacterium]GHV43059.1 tRNA(Ile)-lysidine synthase [Bacteroidia bacterium]